MDHIAEQEAGNMRACVECAAFNGHSRAVAENCEDGAVGCTGCPFNGKPAPTDDDMMRVVDAAKIEDGILKVLLIGNREQCMTFMRAKRGINVDLMYPSGRLSSWVL